MGELIIVTGPPGAGKSTVAPLLADQFEPSVLLTADWFFGRHRRGAIDPWRPEAAGQTRVAGEAAAAAAGVFARAPGHVVYDGFLPPAALPGFAAAAGLAALHYAVLCPPEEVCAARVASRSGHGFTSDSAARSMYREFTAGHLDPRYLVGGWQAEPGVIAGRIARQVAAGGLRWPRAAQANL